MKYENNQVTEQDVLQADVELAEIQRRRLELERMYRVAVARINTLLRRNPDDRRAAGAGAAGRRGRSAAGLAAARDGRWCSGPIWPRLRARMRTEEAAVQLARKQYFPDTEVYGRYDSFWQPAATQGDLRGQVGVNMNMPIYRRKLASRGLRSSVPGQSAAGRISAESGRRRLRSASRLRASAGGASGGGDLRRASCCPWPSKIWTSPAATTTSARARS